MTATSVIGRTTNIEGMDIGCCEEELSPVQKQCYEKALKEYNEAIAELAKLKKEGSVIHTSGSVSTVKTTYHVKVGNLPTLQKLGLATNASTVASLLKTAQLNKSLPVTSTAAQLPKIAPSPLASKPSSTSTGIPSPNPAVLNSLASKGATEAKNAVPSLPKKSPENTSSSAVQQTPAPAPMIVKANEPNGEDAKVAIKNFPSLQVLVRPSKTLPSNIGLKKREALDVFVKARLVLSPRQFAEWLMQVGLLKSKQEALCPLHPSNQLSPLQLGMSYEDGKFPHSGGYVWISQCCAQSFVSIFTGSVFENTLHAPTVILKLIYHWACQTSVSNVIQWVKVDRSYLRSFYTMMRSVCTVYVHTSTPVFGASKNGRVEVGVISLGTTSTDGKRRDVKVEVLGIYDQETQKIRLRASEPITGDSRSRARFARILEPLSKWVSPQAVILTDFTVDRLTLQELGFNHIVQKTLSAVPPEDRLNNRNIMEYLRRTVPKVFQNTLSLLSTASIQQFLDELIWRESWGQSAADAFHNIVRDISAQTRAETGISLVNRLLLVAADPFKDWCVPNTAMSITTQSPTTPTVTLSQSVPTSTPSSSATTAIKRPASSPMEKASSSKQPRIASYYATMSGSKEEAQEATLDTKDAEITCQYTNCGKVLKTNVEMMLHLRQHASRDLAVKVNGEGMDQCLYCLEDFPTFAAKKHHEDTVHKFIVSFKVGSGKEDAAVCKPDVCLICLEKFPQYRRLEQHLQRVHVSCEMPYRCRVCHFRSSSHSLLVDHFYKEHHMSCYLLCPLCLDTFTVKGDNETKGMETGHMQYLTHVKSHLAVPLAKRCRCKLCTLVFLQQDQLQHHVRMDHVSIATNVDTRPFTFTVVNTPAVPATSPVSKPVIKTKTVKEGIRGLDNSMIVRRYSNLSLSESVTHSTYKCVECKEDMQSNSHFPAYLCCPSCRFATCCATAMRTHQNDVHNSEGKSRLEPSFGSVFVLSQTVECKCGFQSRSGLETEKHLSACENGSLYFK